MGKWILIERVFEELMGYAMSGQVSPTTVGLPFAADSVTDACSKVLIQYCFECMADTIASTLIACIVPMRISKPFMATRRAFMLCLLGGIAMPSIVDPLRSECLDCWRQGIGKCQGLV